MEKYILVLAALPLAAGVLIFIKIISMTRGLIKFVKADIKPLMDKKNSKRLKALYYALLSLLYFCIYVCVVGIVYISLTAIGFVVHNSQVLFSRFT